MKGVFILMAGVMAMSAFARTERNSFLDYRASTVSELVQEVETRPDVLGRYERYYSKSGPDVIAYFKSLHVGTVGETKFFQVFSIPPTGYVKMHMEIIKKGEPAFLDQYDQPILRIICGNPLKGNASYHPKTMSSLSPVSPSPVAAALPAPGTTVVAPPALEVLQPPVPPVPVVPVTPQITPTVSVPVPVATSSNGAPWLLVPLIGIFTTSGHGSCCKPPQTVPEPASLLVMATPIIGLIYKKKKRS